jgi:DNA-binding beta-propeller fold protein YncE
LSGSDFSRSTFVLCAAVVVLAGCGGSQALIGTPGAAQPPALAVQAAKTSDLLYVSGSGYVYVYDYPSGKLKQTLDTPGGGLCSDAKGDVYVTNVDLQKIYVYARGALRPKRTLQETNLDPEGCAVDPATGDLAVANQGAGQGVIAIFAGARGTPKLYYDIHVLPFLFCGYDASGNLFADGWTRNNNNFQMVELPKGGKSLAKVSLDQYVAGPGPVIWDGNYLVVGVTGDRIYRFRMSKTSGKEIGYTTLLGGISGGQFIIDDGTLIGTGNYDVLVWKFPAGGEPIQTLAGVYGGYGLALSLANDRSEKR